MNAAVIHSFGEAPRLTTFPQPVAAGDEAIVHVRAAALKPIDKQVAGGTHYASRSYKPPFVCGIDGVGSLDDGSRVFFAMPRAPYGGMAECTVVSRSLCFPVPEEIDDCTAAAIFNAGLSAWAALAWRARLAPGETVLILGATGVTGKLAIQTARLLGAGRIIAAGRNEQVLSTLHEIGADATIQLGSADRNLTEAFAREVRTAGLHVIIDYLWGKPTQTLLAALVGTTFASASSAVRLVQVGESAGSSISLSAAVLRSSRLEILGVGSGSAPPVEMWADARQQLMNHVVNGALRIDTERIALADIEDAWGRDQCGRRFVVVP